MINQRRIKNLIYLASGIGYYRVITSGYDGCTEIYAPTTRVGNAIVRRNTRTGHIAPRPVSFQCARAP